PIAAHNAAGATTAVAIHASGAFSLSGHENGAAVVWDTLSAGEIGRGPMHVGAVTALQVTHDAARFISGGADGTVAMWHLALHPASPSEGRGVVFVKGDPLGRSILPALSSREAWRRPGKQGRRVHTLALCRSEALLAVAAGDGVV